MKSKDEIKRILPNKSSVKPLESTPREIMGLYAEAIKEKYSNSLSALVTETSRVSTDGNEELLSYSFYLIAFIGKGYNYKLFEVVPRAIDTPYPVGLILFEKHPRNVGEFSGERSFSEELYDFFRSPFMANVVNNLIGQVELYRESRAGK